MHTAEIPITDRNESARELLGLPTETRIVLFRALSDYCRPDDAGQGLLTESFREWLDVTSDGKHTITRDMVQSKITALKLHHENYSMALRPPVQQFVSEAEHYLHAMAMPVLLDIREQLKKSLNGHAR